MKNKSLIISAVTALLLAAQAFLPLAARAQDNSWTNLLSDKWENSTNWSLGFAPTNTQSDILITNTATKTATIDATTSGTFPTTLTISNLQVFAPATFTNTLFLNSAGTAVPLEVLNGLTITSGGALVVTDSVLLVDGQSGGNFSDDGSVVLAGINGSIIATNFTTDVGNSGAGQLTLSNGTWLARKVVVGLHTGSSGTLTLAGGTNSLVLTNNFFIALTVGSNPQATGTVWVTGGNLIASNNLATLLGQSGVGQMIVSNGSVSLPSLTLGSVAGSEGTFTMAGGTCNLTDLEVASLGNGAVWMTGGQLAISNDLGVGNAAPGQMTLSNGTVSTLLLNVAENGGADGTFTMAGGTCTSSFFDVANSSGATGAVWITGGQLVITNQHGRRRLRHGPDDDIQWRHQRHECIRRRAAGRYLDDRRRDGAEFIFDNW